MEKFVGIPGSFQTGFKQPRWRNVEIPGIPGRSYEAVVVDGVLRAIVTHDEAGTGGKKLWHLSVGYRPFTPGAGHMRVPSYDEVKHAKYQLVPADVEMVLMFPRKAAKLPFVDSHPCVLHLWEVENEWDAG